MQNLYVTDLDGTLLNDNSQLSAQSIALLNPLLDKGLNFLIATARNYPSVAQIIKDLNYQNPLILSNGAQVVSAKGELLWSYQWSKQQFNDLLNALADDVSSCLFSVYENGYYWLTSRQHSAEIERLKAHYGNKRPTVPIDDLSTIVNDYRLLSVTAIVSEKRGIAVKARLEQLALTRQYNAHLMPYPQMAGLYTLSIVPKAVNKAMGLKACLSYLQRKHDKIVAFGDQSNDLEMLAAADIGVAVANANAALQAMADIVIDSNIQDSVARFIAEHQRENVIADLGV